MTGGNTPTSGRTSATGNVLTNDLDGDEGEKDTLQVSGVQFGSGTGTVGSALAGTYGSLVLNPNGTYTYTLNNADTATQALPAGAEVTEVFSYTVQDANGTTSTNTLTITVNGTNDVPQITSAAAAATGSVTEQGAANPATGTTATGTLTASDVDLGATQTWTIASGNGTYGTMVMDPVTGQWTYTLDNARNVTQGLTDGDIRTETFVARVTDEFGAFSEQTITVTVNGANDRPVINVIGNAANSAVTEQGVNNPSEANTTTGTLTTTDVDTGSTHTWSLVSRSDTYGALSIDPVTGQWTYTLDNARAVTQALNAGQTGTETYTVRVTDERGVYSEQQITVTVNGSNDAPIANVDYALSVKEEGTLLGSNFPFPAGPPVTGNVLTNDQDIDAGQQATLQVGSVQSSNGVGIVGTALNGTYGTLVLNSNGSYTYTLDNTRPATNALSEGMPATEVFTYTAVDASGASSTSTLTVNIIGTNDRPVITSSMANAIGSVTEQDATGPVTTGTATGTLTASDVDQGAIQTWSVVGGSNTYGSITMNPSTGQWVYTLDNTRPATQALNAGDVATETFIARVFDQWGAYSEQPITITVNGTNNAPVAFADTNIAREAGVENGGNTPTSGTPEAIGNVLTNDTDLDAGQKAALTVIAVASGSTAGTVGTALTGMYGSLQLNADGSYTYALNNGGAATQELKQGATAPEVFTYTVRDPSGATSTSTLTITVTGTNDRPEITSAVTAAAGEVTEQGKNNPDAETQTSGTLTASDVDADATLQWSLLSNNGTYGTISINPNSGLWTYTLDNARAATQGLNAGAGDTETFTARVTDENGAYRDQVITITVNGSNDELIGRGPQTITLTEDGAPATGDVTDYVIEVDDVVRVASFQVDVNGGGVPTTFSPNDTAVINDANGDPIGRLTINENGTYSFTPAPNYAGQVPIVTYTIVESSGGTSSVTQTLNFNITEVSDAPTLAPAKSLVMNEDASVSLGLIAPVVTDTGMASSATTLDYPERIGEITLTITGVGKDGVTLTTGTAPDVMMLTPIADKITIVLTDVPHVNSVPVANPANGIYHMTKAQYEALVVHSPAESGQNFTVTVGVSSYEVNSTGTIVTGVAGAPSTQVIDVDVLAVTDVAQLDLIGSAKLGMAEDSVATISSLLVSTHGNTDSNASLDVDGSQLYQYVVTGLPIGSVVTIAGVETTITAVDQEVKSVEGTSIAVPEITVKPPLNFSGDIKGIQVTLTSRDTDTDSTHTIAPGSDSVTIELNVAPVAGDAVAGPVTTVEDTAVAFLANLAVSDTGTGSETIGSVSFTIPIGWALDTSQAAPVTPTIATDGWAYTVTGSNVSITFNDASGSGTVLTGAQRDAILDEFMITPPAHSSADVTIDLAVTTTDTNTVDGLPVSHSLSSHVPLTIVVTPKAETTGTDTDGNSLNDLTMLASHTYTVAGREDNWFALGTRTDGAFNTVGHDLAIGWSNEDQGEFVYAVLTPTLIGDALDDSVIGTEFRYFTTQWETLIYTGEPIWVPQQYLNTLQVKLPEDVSGTLNIKVETGTVDYDDDARPAQIPLDPPRESDTGVSVEVSGSETLSLIRFDPAADAVTMALNGRATGLEDTEIPLSIKTTSSDSSETFNVTISGFPAGAVVKYNGVQLIVAPDGSVTINSFSHTVPLTVTPPLNSNTDFKLTVSAVSVDGASTSSPVSREINVSVTGVADEAVVTLVQTPYVIMESVLDNIGNQVALDDLVTNVVSLDNDTSEVVTLRITGLAPEFSIVGATVVASGTGAERVWLVAADKLADVFVKVPANFSGRVDLQVAGVTTENDGDSRTGTLQNVSFTVTPTAEALLLGNTVLEEDVITSLGLAIAHQNGDTDEVLGAMYIRQDYATGVNYKLYLNGLELSTSTVPTETIAGVDYFKIPAGQIGNLGAMGASNLSGSVGTFDYKYEVIDRSTNGTLGAGTPELKDGSLSLTATPVTDAVDVSISGMAAVTAVGTFTDRDTYDLSVFDKATLTTGGDVVVTLKVTTADTDGSEHLVRVLIEGVPEGVTVNGAQPLGTGGWLFIYDASSAPVIGTNGLDVPVTFFVGAGAGSGTSTIKMTVQAQDGTPPSAGIEEASVQWELERIFSPGQLAAAPLIAAWDYNGAIGTEDVSFDLADVMTGTVTVPNNNVSYSYTVSITDLPTGTTVGGMTLTTINGVPTWTATTVVPAQGDSQVALNTLLAGITITPPANSNDNNSNFAFNAKLTASAVGGRNDVADESVDMPITPVSDAAIITVMANDVNEGTSSVTATIAANPTTDGVFGEIVDGELYVQVSTSGNSGGTVFNAGTPVALTTVTGVAGIANGDYYVLNVGKAGGAVTLTYQAADGTVLKAGDVTFTASAVTKEVGAGNTQSSSASGTADVIIINNGVNVAQLPVTGFEPNDAVKSQAIQLRGFGVTLIDNEGLESINSILLSGLPVGFLLYVGTNAADAQIAAQASNAGGDGTTNTWVLSSGTALPPYVAILPPPHWSGTLSGLTVVVESGEATLPIGRVDTVTLHPVTVQAVANGLTIDPTISFGREGTIVDVNINAAMVDAVAATSTAPDQSVETTTLQIKGLGAHAAFYQDEVLITGVVYDPNTDTYTITGLSQDALDTLGFVQAAKAITDQNSQEAGAQVTVTAWTVESGTGVQSAPVTDSMTVAMSPVLATTGDDKFIWDGSAINGKAGIDTVALRYDEDLTNVRLANTLRNIEELDLSAPGAQSITGGLSISDVVTITGSTTGQLTITGDGDDWVELSSASGWNTTGAVTGNYVTYTSNAGATLRIDEDIYNNSHVTFVA